ncbi:hypothetical protein Tco_0847828 [Tanacetum coccineum]
MSNQALNPCHHLNISVSFIEFHRHWESTRWKVIAGPTMNKRTKVNSFVDMDNASIIATFPADLREEPVRPGKNKRKKGRKLYSGNQVRQRFRESFQEERAAIRGIVPKEKEGEQQYWELFPKEGRPIDSGNQSKKTAYLERQIQKREKGRKRFRESFEK